MKKILLLAACTCIFSAVFYLTDVPVSSAGYAGLLCLTLLIIVFVFQALRNRRRRKQLEFIKSELPDNFPPLPDSQNNIEQQYHDIITDLKNAYDSLVRSSTSQKKDMTDYYTMWAHQIKTPIAAMHLLLQSGQCGTDELESELFRIEEYVEMVLGYQRLTGGGTDLLLRRQSLDAIIRQSIRKYARQFIRKKLSVEYEGTDLEILTDEKWLCFVLDQLLSNALKYTSSGKIAITVHENCLTVRDTGIGIKPEDLPRMFQRGFTGYNGRADKKSTGIGLYMCKKVCNMLGHEISISSCVDVGTEVTVRFSND